MIALLTIVLLVLLLWTAVVFLRGGLLAGCLLVLLATSCFGHAFYKLLLGPIPLTADRLLWVVLIGACLVWRRMRLVEPKPLGGAEIALYAFIGVLVASTFSHHWQADHYQPVARLVFAYLMPLGLYWAARQVRLSERGALAVFACLGLFGLYLAVTALAETGQWWQLVYPRYIGSPRFAEFLGRARGPLLNPVGSGLLQAVCICAGLMWWPRLGRTGRALLVAGLLAAGVGIYCTLTRSVWLGAAIGLLVLVGLAVPKSWRVLVLGTMLLGATVVGATQGERILAFKRDRHLSAQETLESVRLRPVLAVVAWNMFLDRPALGCGFGQYPHQSVYYLADRSSGLCLEKARPYGQHNVFLALLAETGLLGMGLFVILLAVWARDAWRLWRCGHAPRWVRQMGLVMLVLLANYLAGGMFHDLSLIFAVHMFLFFVAGLAAGLRHYAHHARPAGLMRAEAAGVPRRPRLSRLPNAPPAGSLPA